MCAERLELGIRTWRVADDRQRGSKKPTRCRFTLYNRRNGRYLTKVVHTRALLSWQNIFSPSADDVCRRWWGEGWNERESNKGKVILPPRNWTSTLTATIRVVCVCCAVLGVCTAPDSFAHACLLKAISQKRH